MAERVSVLKNPILMVIQRKIWIEEEIAAAEKDGLMVWLGSFFDLIPSFK